MPRATPSHRRREKPTPPPALYEMAAHLLLAEQPFSRNRNFGAFEDPRFRAALALYRRLRGLVRDLEDAARSSESRLELTEELRGGRPSVRVLLSSPTTRRTAWLERPAWEVLLRHPSAMAAIAALRDR